jgi:hypothetical protein
MDLKRKSVVKFSNKPSQGNDTKKQKSFKR